MNKSRRARWRGLHKQRKFFENVAKKLSISSLDDWYRIKLSSLRTFAGSGLLATFYSSSAVKALVAAYPEHQWKLWNFDWVPKGFWKDWYNRRAFFDWLGEKLGYVSFNCWYSISAFDVKNHGGSGLLLNSYNDSVYNAIHEIYPEYPWIPWKFNNVPLKYWSDLYRRRSYFDWLGQELCYMTFNSWYSITGFDIKRNGGNGLLSTYYNNSVYNAVMEVYPEYPWIPWRFNSVPKNIWDRFHKVWYLDWLGQELGYGSFDGWYRITRSDIEIHGGSGLLSNNYSNSLYKLIQDIYSEYPWIPWKFQFLKPLPRSSPDQLRFDKLIFSTIYVRHLSDWYRIPIARVKKFGISNKEELIRALEKMYPEFEWNPKMFQNTRRKILQWKLKRLLEEIVENKSPMVSVFEDFWGLDSIAHPSGRMMELDIFVPFLNLAFEYQGIQHFENHHLFGTSSDYKLKDHLKRITCKRFGITLIEVPYSLYLDEVSVADLVCRTRPDIMMSCQN